MSYATILDWASTLAGLLFCAFLTCAAFLSAWSDRRGPAHRLPLLVLSGVLALFVAGGAYGYIGLRHPFHVGDALWAQSAALMVVGTAGIILWHGFGTCLKGFARKPHVESPVLPTVHNNAPWTGFETRQSDATPTIPLPISASDSSSTN